jgi:NTP pyrophosphatase (non-canonical NTP hydrolase)
MNEDRIEALRAKIRKFRDERDWAQFHNPKDMAISISIEASELLEHFQWKDKDAVEKRIKEKKDGIEEEMADIYIYLLEMADNLGIDLIDAAKKKLDKNAAKYPVEKAKGSAKKYTEL